jgi:hypothetical protein
MAVSNLGCRNIQSGQTCSRVVAALSQNKQIRIAESYQNNFGLGLPLQFADTILTSSQVPQMLAARPVVSGY